MRPLPSFRYGLLLAGVTLWLLLIAAAAAGRAYDWPAWTFLYAFFDPLCHQIPERSFHLLGSPLGVCHRCFGIYTGTWLGLLLWPWLERAPALLLRRPRLFLLFLVPMGVDLCLENNVWSRFLTGILAGIPVGLFVWAAVEQLPGFSFPGTARKTI